MSKTLDPNAYIQGSPAWLEVRKKNITATDMPAIMGVSPYKTAFQLFEEKLGYREVQQTGAMLRGQELEPEARKELCEIFGVELKPEVCFHPHLPFMASLDAYNVEHELLCEIKCGLKDYEHVKQNHAIPPHYYPQLQWQMYITGMSKAYYYGYNGLDGILLLMERDNAYVDEMVAKATEFYECLNSLEPPALTDKDVIQRDDPDWNHWAEQYRKHKNLMFIAETQMEEAKNKLIELAGDRCAMGNGVKVTRYARRGSIEYKSIPELENVDLDKYRKNSTLAWRVT